VLADIGDEQSIAADLSTFFRTYAEPESMLDVATESSLILVDDNGHRDGAGRRSALAVALLEEFRGAAHSRLQPRTTIA